MVQHVKGRLRLAPCLVAMEREANRLAPTRSKASDGSFPSAAHTAANPTSDHETGDALDLTHDPARFDMADRFRLIVARRDRRVKYLIFNGTIWKAYANRGHPPWHPQPYTGSNPHRSHGHVSVVDDYRNDVSPWWPEHDQDEEFDMDEKRLREIIREENDRQNLQIVAAVKDVLGDAVDSVKAHATTIRDGLAKLIRGG